MRKHPRMPSCPDDSPLIFNKEEQQVLAELNSQLSAIQRKKLEYVREVARKKGIIASTLKELKSKSGKPFVEVSSTRMSDNYREAEAKAKTAGLSKLELQFQETEKACLCHDMYSKEDQDSCGWVKGTPIEKKYDNISILSGSAGIHYYCKICGKMIGSLVMVRS